MLRSISPSFPIKAAVLLWALSSCPALWAQRYAFHNLSIENGLPQSSIRALHQDAKGFLWFGTLAGVRRFDGVEFRNPFLRDVERLHAARFITEDSRGRVWIATDRGAVTYSDNGIQHYKDFDGIQSPTLNHIIEDSQGWIWFATNFGISVLKQDGTIRNFGPSDGLEPHNVNRLYEDHQGHIWLGTDNGLLVYDRTSFRDKGLELGLPPVRIRHLFGENSQAVWIGTDNGLYAWVDRRLHHYDAQSGLGGNSVRAIVRDRAGYLWTGHENGVCRLDLSAGYAQPRKLNLTSANGLCEGSVFHIIEDREGNLWFGTNSGASKLNNLAFVSFTKDQGMGSDVWSIVQEESGRLWLGTQRGVYSLEPDLENAVITPWRRNQDLPSQEVRGLHLEKDGTLWLATRHGLARHRDGHLKIWTRDDGLPDDFMRNLHKDREGRLWAATENGGLIYLTASDDETLHFLGPSNGLPTKRVFCTYQARNGRLWFGTESGLAYLDGDPAENRIQVLSERDGLPYNRVLCVNEDAEGRIWVGTTFGMAYYQNGEFHNFTRANGLHDEFIYFLIFDRNQALWMGTNKGVTRYQNDHFHHFNTHHGLAFNEMNVNAALLDRDGRLWFGCRGGVNRVNPDSVIINHTRPPVYITDFAVLNKSRPAVPNQELKHNENHVRIQFAALSYAVPESTLFRHKLVGLDSEWQVGTDRVVQYASLPPGQYSLVVEAQNEAGLWSEQPATFGFTIKPPYWRRPWFIGFGVFFLITLIYLRIKDLQKRNDILAREAELLLEKVEAEKAIELRQEAEIRLLHSQMNPHFLQNALNTAIYFAGNDTEKAKKILRKLSQIFRMNHKATLEGWSTLAAEITLIENYMEIQQLRFSDKLTYSADCPPDLLEEVIPGFIIQPLVENAAVHGVRNTLDPVQVTLTCRGSDDEIHVAVANNGQPLKRPFQDFLSEEHALGNINKRLHLLYNRNLHYSYEDGNLIFSFSMRRRHESHTGG
ncbi:Histidine kinase [Sulfidibacter corallicola]|uniref:Histidine kinase n=1 Tax=Sulfidibacter corallicola TaxID=2818388 RepID=A0A8A4TW19_SULCO|nr:sensor histidine kinase [Sulfidibacter corallicola]QTD53162.1 histidine kinase [Sulfidibacter corallicola]